MLTAVISSSYRMRAPIENADNCKDHKMQKSKLVIFSGQWSLLEKVAFVLGLRDG